MLSPMAVLASVLKSDAHRFVPPGTVFISMDGVKALNSKEEISYRKVVTRLMMLDVVEIIDWLRATEAYQLVGYVEGNCSDDSAGISWVRTVATFHGPARDNVPEHQMFLLFHEEICVAGEEMLDSTHVMTQLIVACDGLSIDLGQNSGINQESVLKSGVLEYLQWLELTLTRKLASYRRRPTALTMPTPTTQEPQAGAHTQQYRPSRTIRNTRPL